MLNSNIKIDLHIHSKMSEYKENDGYVDESNIDNIDILLSKLNEEEINLFSITDHNRFDFELYEKIKSTINKEPYQKVNNILPGIEFDVNMEDGCSNSCHIVCIFNDEDIESIKVIPEAIKKIRLLTQKDEAYTIKEFEDILYEIGTSVVLIAHQKSGLNTATGKKSHHSLSDSSTNPAEWIKIGYINALEYQTPKVQGILKDSLKDIKEEFATVTGSDCHVWSAYPKKDHAQSNDDIYFTKIKALPTFKGLVMALSSPETRFDRKNEGELSDYIENIKINGKKYELSTGINAIIGENGSGKTFVLSELCGEKNIPKYKIMEKTNDIKVSRTGNPGTMIIKQGEIIEKVKKGTLLENNSEFYEEINTVDEFKENIRNYVNNLKKYILNNIKSNENENSIKEKKIAIRDCINVDNYYVSLNTNIDIKENNPSKRKKVLNDEYNKILLEYNNNVEFYSGDKKTKIELVLTTMQSLINDINKESEQIDDYNKVVNIVTSVFSDKNIIINKKRSSQEKESEDYRTEIRNFANEIKKYLQLKEVENELPIFPKEVDGTSVKSKLGFRFIKEARYSNLNLEEPLYKAIFTQQFQKEEKIKTIHNKDTYIKAVAGVTTYEALDEKLNQNVEKFLEEYTKEETRIRKENGTNEIGTTPGEIALTFYELILSENGDKDVILVDQPEDDISMKRIEEYLLDFFNRVRDKKQVIFVTHNPLLVVNLDVDNVIYLSKDRTNLIDVQSGCMESPGIIDIVSQYLDGGKEAIERRLKVYGNN